MIYLDVAPYNNNEWMYRVYICGTFAYSCVSFLTEALARQYGVFEIMATWRNYDSEANYNRARYDDTGDTVPF